MKNAEVTQPHLGTTFGVGSLPHRSVSQALEFVWQSTDIPTIPSLPRRSPMESMIAQALVGIEGVSVGQYASIGVDVAAIDVDHFITTDLKSEAYGAFEAFLNTFHQYNNGAKAVKWQFVGPVTLGVSLVRIGISPHIAFPLALQAVSSHLRNLQNEVAKVCGDITQIIVLDETEMAVALEPGFFIGVEAVIDLISGALSAIAETNISGLHSCGNTDWGALIATGANIISVPVPSAAHEEQMTEMIAAASRISDHLAHGGHIAWGAIRTDGPIAVTDDRSFKALMESMCALVQAGVDPLLLRRMSYVTPAGGLSSHSDPVAGRVFSHVRSVSVKVAEQATASRLTHGS